MKKVRVEGDRFLVKRPPEDLSPEAARKYLAELKAELTQIIGPAPYDVGKRIDLEDGSRGGYFHYLSAALSALVAEVIDRAKTPAVPRPLT